MRRKLVRAVTPVIRRDTNNYVYGVTSILSNSDKQTRLDVQALLDYVLGKVVEIGGTGKLIALYDPEFVITLKLDEYQTKDLGPTRRKKIRHALTDINNLMQLRRDGVPLKISIQLEVIVG